MKRIILNVCICILLLLSFSACANDNIVSLTSAGNIQNGGYIVKHPDGYIYTKQSDNDLYVYTDGKESSISGGTFHYELNYYNGEIYYVSGSPGKVWKISVDGKDKTKLIDQHVGNLIVYGERIYYRLSEDDDWGKLYSSDLNGENKKLLAPSVVNFCIYEDTIYYHNREGTSSLCSMNVDGENKKVINDSYVSCIIVQNGKLIYADYNRDDKLYLYDLENGTEECICEDICWDLNCNEDWIFYRNQSEKGSLYCVSFDGNTKHELLKGNVSDINIIDDLVIYRNIVNDSKMEYFNLKDKLS